MTHSKFTDYFRRLRIRTGSWEYWPMWLVYGSVAFYYVYLSIKARSLLFFSASNPSINYGGMCFERKSTIYEILPEGYYPYTCLIFPDHTRSDIEKKLLQHKIEFPLIAKPDIGGKGWGVKKISSIDELLLYQQFCKVEFLVQQWVSYPLELSIFYCRYPSWKSGIITSVTGKSLLSVTGNGIDTIETLIRKNDRSFLQLESLRKQKNISMNAIPAKGEKVVLVPYGNHARGALFNDYQSCINEKMVNVIDELSKKIDGFYFGRFDLLTTSLDDLYVGKNISIVELNGCGAEPIHIYEPSFRFIKAQKVIWQHFRMMYDIAMENKKRGVNFITPAYFIKGWKEEMRYKKMAPADKLIISQKEKHH